jgi:hypothetical protein
VRVEQQPPSLFLFSLQLWGEHCHMLLPWCLPQVQSNGDNLSWTITQNKPFLL